MLRGWRGRFLIFRGRWPGGLLTCGPTCQCFTKPIRAPHEAEQRQKQHVVNLKKDEGEADSATSEMMVASSLQLLFLALLLRPSNLTAGKVQLCDLTPHFITTPAP